MKYLGKFTGKLYSSEEKQNGLIFECALQLSDDEAENEEYLSERRARDRLDCLFCINSGDGVRRCEYSNDREAYLAKLHPKNPIPGRIL